MSVIGNRIKEQLKKMNMTQKELAERSCITEATISRYLTGERNPKYDNLANIATVLHTTVKYLLGENEEEYKFPYIKSIIARNAEHLSYEEKTELIKTILEG